MLILLDGNGGTPAVDRQNALITQLGYTPAEALSYLNLTDFDMDGDDDFDADDVAAINALVPELVLEIAVNGATMDIQWTSRAATRLYDLESLTDLLSGVWSAYNDGTVTYTNIPGEMVGTILSVTNAPTGSDTRFFKVIEK